MTNAQSHPFIQNASYAYNQIFIKCSKAIMEKGMPRVFQARSVWTCLRTDHPSHPPTTMISSPQEIAQLNAMDLINGDLHRSFYTWSLSAPIVTESVLNTPLRLSTSTVNHGPT